MARARPCLDVWMSTLERSAQRSSLPALAIALVLAMLSVVAGAARERGATGAPRSAAPVLVAAAVGPGEGEGEELRALQAAAGDAVTRVEPQQNPLRARARSGFVVGLAARSGGWDSLVGGARAACAVASRDVAPPPSAGWVAGPSALREATRARGPPAT